jgi:hypothetical protein
LLDDEPEAQEGQDEPLDGDSSPAAIAAAAVGPSSAPGDSFDTSSVTSTNHLDADDGHDSDGAPLHSASHPLAAMAAAASAASVAAPPTPSADLRSPHMLLQAQNLLANANRAVMHELAELKRQRDEAQQKVSERDAQLYQLQQQREADQRQSAAQVSGLLEQVEALKAELREQKNSAKKQEVLAQEQLDAERQMSGALEERLAELAAERAAELAQDEQRLQARRSKINEQSQQIPNSRKRKAGGDDFSQSQTSKPRLG